MGREPFVWESQARREIIETELAELLNLPYSLWRELIDSAMTKTAVGRDGTQYQVLLRAAWKREGSEDIVVTLTLKLPRRPFRKTMTETFLITPEGVVRK